MIESDTVKLLRECDAGIRMGISSINDVIDHTKNTRFRSALERCRQEHRGFQAEIGALLERCHDEGKDPPPIAKGMSKLKTDFKLMADDSDKTVADLMVDGCNMGVKSLTRYLNQYQAASEDAKDLAKRLIRSEDELAIAARPFL